MSVSLTGGSSSSSATDDTDVTMQMKGYVPSEGGISMSDVGAFKKGEVTESVVSDAPVGVPNYAGAYGTKTSIVRVNRGVPFPRTGNFHILPRTRVQQKVHNIFITHKFNETAHIPPEGLNMGCWSNVTQGSLLSQRIGDKINITGITFNLVCRAGFNQEDGYNTMTNPDWRKKKGFSVRLFLFVRRENKGQDLASTSLVYNTPGVTTRPDTFTALRNLEHTGRIDVLWSETVDFNASFVQFNGGPSLSTTYCSSPSQVHTIRWESTTSSFPIEYLKDSSTGGVTEQLGNSLQFAIMTSAEMTTQPADTTKPPYSFNIDGTARVYFEDD